MPSSLNRFNTGYASNRHSCAASSRFCSTLAFEPSRTVLRATRTRHTRTSSLFGPTQAKMSGSTAPARQVLKFPVLSVRTHKLKTSLKEPG
jgi:hypothetical protein